MKMLRTKIINNTGNHSKRRFHKKVQTRIKHIQTSKNGNKLLINSLNDLIRIVKENGNAWSTFVIRYERILPDSSSFVNNYNE